MSKVSSSSQTTRAIIGRGYRNSSAGIHRIRHDQTDRKMNGAAREILSSSIVSQDSVQRSWIRTWGRSPPEGLAREALSRTVPQCPQIANAVSGSRIIHHWIAEPMSFPSLCSTPAGNARYGSSSGKEPSSAGNHSFIPYSP